MPDVALSMIVRNEEQMLRGCLESARGAVQEIVIADTGSTDGTAEIAREFGARIVDIPWQNNFAEARNRALAGIRSGWILSLDADERLDVEAVKQISDLMAESSSAAYQVTIRNYVLSLEDRIWDRPAQANDLRLAEARQFPGFVDHENVRFFRRSREIYFVGRVHESVGPQVQAAGLPLGRAPFLIHHLGLTSDEQTRARKNIFYRELGKQKILDRPNDAQAHLELGLVELDNFGNLPEALACFQRACELNPRFGVAWFFAGVTQIRREEPSEALICLQKAEQCGHHTTAVAELMGDAFYNLGEFAAAASAYRKAHERQPDSVQIESKLGLALGRSGNTEEAFQWTNEALRKRPDIGELHDRGVQLLTWTDRIGEAAAAAEQKLRTVPKTSAADFARAALLWQQTGNLARAVAVLHVGLQIYKEDPQLLQALTDLKAHDGETVNRLVTALRKGTDDSYQD